MGKALEHDASSSPKESAPQLRPDGRSPCALTSALFAAFSAHSKCSRAVISCQRGGVCANTLKLASRIAGVERHVDAARARAPERERGDRALGGLSFGRAGRSSKACPLQRERTMDIGTRANNSNQI
jgi:hypothetical protein